MNPNPKKVTETLMSRGLQLLFIACIFLSSGSFLNLQANNFTKISFQIPVAKTKSATSSKVRTSVTKTTKKTVTTKKKKTGKAAVKDSIVVEIDPTNSNPPLFQKQ